MTSVTHKPVSGEPLPPPPPPQPELPLSPRTNSDPGTEGLWTLPTEAGGDLSGDKVMAILKWWLRPLTEARTWQALGYLWVTALVGVPFAIALFGFGVLVFGLMFIAVGFLLIVPWFRLNAVMVRGQLAIAASFGYDIVERDPPAPVRGVGWSAIKQVMSDPKRWRHVGFLLFNIFLGFAIASVGSAPLGFTPSFSIGGSALFVFGHGGLVGLLLLPVTLGLLPRVAIYVAKLRAEIDRALLGSGRLALAEQRVTTLSGHRDDILDAVAAERKRIERNLHDGVQQQLVAIGLDLGMADTKIDTDPAVAHELIASARDKVRSSIGELRQLGRGLHPAILEDRGLDAALSAVVTGAPIPIEVHVDRDLELGREYDEMVYFVVNEAVGNILKHAAATAASIHVLRLGSHLRVIIHDNGQGGAKTGGGTGLAGIRARVHAVDGMFSIESPAGGPTTINVEVPLR